MTHPRARRSIAIVVGLICCVAVAGLAARGNAGSEYSVEDLRSDLALLEIEVIELDSGGSLCIGQYHANHRQFASDTAADEFAQTAAESAESDGEDYAYEQGYWTRNGLLISYEFSFRKDEVRDALTTVMGEIAAAGGYSFAADTDRAPDGPCS